LEQLKDTKKISPEGRREIDYRRLTVMQYRNNKTRPAPIFRAWEDSPTIRIILAQRQKLVLGLTLVEMVIAIAIMTIIFAAILPQFRIVQNSWDSQAGAAETLQNGRVLIDHLNRNLSKATRITAVSSPSETNGYIEFQDNDANNLRYDIGVSNYVEFGPIGSLSDLAGPVSKLQFSCYGAVDLSTPITDVNAIRSVKVETTMTNPAKLDQDMTFTTQAYIRTNALPAVGGDISMSEPWLEFDPQKGMQPALVHMSGSNYLCAYRGYRDDGFACILTVDGGNWSVSKGSSVEYDTKNCATPALAKIDDENFLCAYTGDRADGWACILYEWPVGSGTIEKGPEVEFDTDSCYNPALSHINTQGDDHYYFCAYSRIDNVHALVLKATIIPFVLMNLTSAGPTISWNADVLPDPALAKIDTTHYLCVYEGETVSKHGAAVVLTVNTGDWTITPEIYYDFGGELAMTPALAKIDSTHYLCAYGYWDPSYEGRAVVLTVNPVDWSVTKETSIQVDTYSRVPELSQIDSTNFLCAYWDASGAGVVVVLTVNTGDWTISKGTPFTFDSPGSQAALCQIDAGHYLCAHESTSYVGIDGVLELSSGGILP